MPETIVNVPPAVINVAPPNITVEAPHQRSVIRTVERDDDGKIVSVTERVED